MNWTSVKIVEKLSGRGLNIVRGDGGRVLQTEAHSVEYDERSSLEDVYYLRRIIIDSVKDELFPIYITYKKLQINK